jgi:hypothetical protein
VFGGIKMKKVINPTANKEIIVPEVKSLMTTALDLIASG